MEGEAACAAGKLPGAASSPKPSWGKLCRVLTWNSAFRVAGGVPRMGPLPYRVHCGRVRVPSWRVWMTPVQPGSPHSLVYLPASGTGAGKA